MKKILFAAVAAMALVEVEIEDEIKVDDVETPPSGGGGIGGDVGDWDDETNVELPVG